MYIPFEEMSPTARIWIYQADKQMTEEQENQIGHSTKEFLDGWAAHGNPLNSSFVMLHSKFLVISVDESYNLASGCSIDASVALVRRLEEQLNLNFFDRSKVAFLLNGEIFQSSMADLKELISEGKINSDTITFNNLVANVDQLKNQWKTPAGETWLKRYF
jgi:hypothetical protein